VFDQILDGKIKQATQEVIVNLHNEWKTLGRPIHDSNGNKHKP